MTTTETMKPQLTEADRCDRCGARAKMMAELPSGSVLYFCGHHSNDHANALLDLGAALTSIRKQDENE